MSQAQAPTPEKNTAEPEPRDQAANATPATPKEPPPVLFPTAEAVQAGTYQAPEIAPPVPSPDQPTEEAMDEGVEQSFPASDPLAVQSSKA